MHLAAELDDIAAQAVKPTSQTLPFAKIARSDAAVTPLDFDARLLDLCVPGQLGGTTTGTEGQFHLARLGRDRVVHLRIDGPSIRPSTVTVLTVAPGTHLPDHDEEGRAVYGATFVHRAAPAAPGRP